MQTSSALSLQSVQSVWRQPARGVNSLDASITVVAIIVILAVLLGFYYSFSKSSASGTELTNIQSLMTNTSSMLKTRNGYVDVSIDALYRAGGVPSAMSYDMSGGTLNNTWGGEVKVATGTGSSGATVSNENLAFTLTYEKVPESACVNIANQLSRTGAIAGITVNGSVVDKDDSIADITGYCSDEDDNTLAFTSVR
ncbi:type 4 pilus major pilin [Klebsiella quasipneumoniae]|uniref:type 4 pilus major pilin n=1 Tax=Klebsiella quasipneumoniae TaxID=1463165 RepID=UPI00244C7FFB|nr:type 4 pilus major pilin [Klebsiella quasipneumoniae]MDH2672414.1 type 4 pilus major pilin [Klebsiella quasipneumoniae]